jgi:hypothetical protein
LREGERVRRLDEYLGSAVPVIDEPVVVHDGCQKKPRPG